MLDLIRSNSQSLMVKIAFGVIILVFVFWGVGNLVDTGSVNLVGKVNGSPISYAEFERQYMQAEEELMRRSPGLKREALRDMGLGRHVFDRLVLEQLLKAEAARVGLAVTGLELRHLVATFPAFQKDGKFDGALYTRMLEAQRTTPARFEAGLTAQLLQEKMQRLLTGAVHVSPGEVRAFFDVQNERRVVDYVAFPAADFMAASAPSDEEARKFYDEHGESFAIPARVELEYLLVAPDTLVTPESLDDAAVAEWYARNTGRFAVPEQRRVRHILVKLAEDAPEADVRAAEARIKEISDALAAGQSFAELARQHSDDVMSGREGGELGWIGRGQTVPPFEEAAFGAPIGKVTAPVRSQFGLHLLLVEEARAAGVRPLAEVADEVRREMAGAQGAEKLRDALDALVEASLLGKPLAEAGKPFGLAVRNDGLKSAAELQAMGLSAKDAETVMKTPAGATVDAPLEAGDNRFMLVKVLKSEPAGTEPFEAVRAGIVDRLRREAALKAAMDRAVEVRRTIVDGALPANVKAAVKTAAAPMTRQGGFDGFMPDAALTSAVFATGSGLWLPAAYTLSDEKGESAAVLVRVGKIIPGTDEEFAQWKDMLTAAMTRERQEAAFQTFLEKLFATARIELLNPDVVNRREPGEQEKRR